MPNKYGFSGKFICESGRTLLPELVNKINTEPDSVVFSESTKNWSHAQKSTLVESVILNLPIPRVLTYEPSSHVYEIIDGNQRVKAVLEFFNNQYSLNGLTILEFLNGFSFDALPYQIKDKLNASYLYGAHIIHQGDISPQDLEILVSTIKERWQNNF